MSKIYDSIEQLIGRTPLLRIKKGKGQTTADILLKLESFNPFHSVKDRIGFAMIDQAEQEGKISPDKTVIIEATSGNTGIGLAFVAASRGYRVIFTMPESMSIERRKILKALGAQCVLTEAARGMRGAIEKAQEIANNTPNSWIPAQFDNPSNPAIHYRTTGPEIWQDTDGNVDVLVCGVGTGGTITGTGMYLKEQNPNLYVVAVEPADSPVLSGGAPGSHKIQGIGAGFVPSILNTKIYNEVYRAQLDESMQTSRALAQQEGVFVGISSGAIAAAAIQIGQRPEWQGKTIVAVIPDFGERYFSTVLFQDIEA